MAPQVLLTGASGYLGSHVLDLLLHQGYSVRFTARSQAKADKIIARYPQFQSRIEVAIVQDIIAPTAYDNAIRDITYVVHVASPLASENTTDYERDLLNPAVEGTVNILRAAASVTSVSRVVITSSIASIMGPFSPLTEEHWNPITREIALKGPGFVAYVASKKLAEEAVWDFVEKQKPHYAVTTICPPFLYGPFVHPIETSEDVGSTPHMLYTYVEHKLGADAHEGLDSYIDVRDAALAHIAAFEKPAAKNQRYLVAAGNYSWQDITDIVQKHFPGKTKSEVGTPGVYPAPKIISDTTKAQQQLGVVYRSKETTVREFFAQVFEFTDKGGVIKF